MTVNELLGLIPANTFRDLAVETKVDTQVKKLSGEVMFKLIFQTPPTLAQVCRPALQLGVLISLQNINFHKVNKAIK